MWTISDTNVTTHIIIAVSPSMRNPISIFSPPTFIHG